MGIRASETGTQPPGCPTELSVRWVELGGQRYLVLSHPLDARGATVERAALTPAERDVVSAVLAGLSNEEIGRRRGTSPRTIAKQLERIYQKMGVESRAELCVVMMKNEPAA